MMREGVEVHLDDLDGSGPRDGSFSLKTALIQTFLPIGYPASVKAEYLDYQVWDSLQALSSYIRGVLSSRFVFQGLGVGDDTATGLGAALAWVYKDGVGIVSSLLFAYKYTPYFDAYPSSFRLVADTLCNLGLLLNMSVGVLPSSYFIVITSLSSICFGCLGIAAGATKSKISSHLAEGGHLGDLMAKESTQESAVTLLGMLCGVAITSVIGESLALSWVVFFLCTLFHQYANYRLVKVLQFNTLNNQRLWLLSEQLHEHHLSAQGVPLPTPSDLAHRESLFSFPLWLSLYGPAIGKSVTHALHALPLSSGRQVSWEGKWSEVFRREDGSCPFVVDVERQREGESRTERRVVVFLSRDCDEEAKAEACLVAYAWHQALREGPVRREESRLRRLVSGARSLIARLRQGEAGWTLEGVCLAGDRRFRYFDAGAKRE